MPTLQEMIANKALPDDYIFSTADGNQFKLGDFRGHLSASEKRVQDELTKLQTEWEKIKQAQADISALYTHLSTTSTQVPPSGTTTPDELDRYTADENWSPVVKRLLKTEQNLNSALQRIGEQYQKLQNFLWQTRFENEYFTHQTDFGELDFQGAIKEMQSGNHLRELAPGLKVPSLVPLAESRRNAAKQKKELEEATAKAAKVSAADRLPKPSAGGPSQRVPATNNKLPADANVLQRNPFAGIRDAVNGDQEIAAIANP